VVIIDDGSTDATIEIADELAGRFPQVRAVRHGKRLGRAVAVQTGIKSSTGEVIFLRDEQCGLSINEIHHHWHALKPRGDARSREAKVATASRIAAPARDGGFHVVHRSSIEAVARNTDEAKRLLRRPSFLDRQPVR
jgi:glycosyltransferase involved in cell wall biosynthesis